MAINQNPQQGSDKSNQQGQSGQVSRPLTQTPDTTEKTADTSKRSDGDKKIAPNSGSPEKASYKADADKEADKSKETEKRNDDTKEDLGDSAQH